MSRIPPYMTMALGAGEVTPLSLAAAYAVFANGGRAVTPWHLLKVTDKDGRVLESLKRRCCASGDRSAQCFYHDQPDAGRDSTRHGNRRSETRA
jgi:membrane carboxypeptidase/penicillin-binding protein